LSRTGIIFDFDGVIALSEPVHMQAWRDLALELGGRPLPVGFLEKGVGHTDQELSRELAAFWGNDPDFDTVLAGKRRHYQNRCLTDSVLVPGVDRALRYFAKHFPIGLATSASMDDVTPTLERYKIKDYFDVLLTIESVARPKPHPEIYLKAAQALEVDPEKSFVFEDSPTGATAARAAGMNVIGLTTTFPRPAIEPVLDGIPDYGDLERVISLIQRRIQA
jgi:beta-phosphoglucomutase